MKYIEKSLVVAAFVGISAWATPAFSQGESESTGPSIRERVGGRVDNDLNFLIKPSEQLLQRAFANIENLPEDLQEDVLALQASMEAIRSAWVNDYRPGEGATIAEIKEARDLFLEDMAEEIEANRELRKEVVVQLREGLRDRIGEDGLSEETKAAIKAYNEVKRELASAWLAIRSELGSEATREEVAEAREQFLEENAEVIAQQKELAKEIRAMIREEIRDRPGIAGRVDDSEAVQALRAEMQFARVELREKKREVREALKDLSPEERQEQRAELLEELREAHDELKERRRQLIDEIRGDQDGDRRPGD